MQTSISQIPLNKSPSSSMSMDDDPDVASVIEEMNNISQPPPFPPQQQQPSNNQDQIQKLQQQLYMQQQQIQQQQMQNQQQQQMQQQQQQQQTTSSSFNLTKIIDVNIAQKAFAAAFIALIVFYPKELGILYEKFPILEKIAPYERIVRAILLALLFYVLFIKLNI